MRVVHPAKEHWLKWFVETEKLKTAKLGVGLFLMISGFYLMGKNQDMLGIIVTAIGLFIIGVSQ